MIKISPSLLSADLARLADEIKRIEAAGADMVHIDVMDGHFVPNITYGPPVIKSIRKATGLVFDVHLMIEGPGRYIDDFAAAGADLITVHAEGNHHLNRLIQSIKHKGLKAAVALNPSTPVSTLEWVLEDLDMVLLMTVNPGFGGQKFLKNMPGKIEKLKNMILCAGLKTEIQADGGIGIGNIYEVTKAGADVIVVGSALFNAPDIGKFISEMREKAFAGY